jgi:hypothetical protein
MSRMLRRARTAYTVYLKRPEDALVEPPPLLVGADHVVSSGMPRRLLPKLLGFADPASGIIGTWAREIAADPTAAVGTRPVLLVDGRVWRHPGIVDVVTVRAPAPQWSTQ